MSFFGELDILRIFSAHHTTCRSNACRKDRVNQSIFFYFVFLCIFSLFTLGPNFLPQWGHCLNSSSILVVFFFAGELVDMVPTGLPSIRLF